MPHVGAYLEIEEPGPGLRPTESGEGNGAPNLSDEEVDDILEFLADED